MAYIGRTPTNAALTASDLADGIVTTAKIDADAVTSAKIADNAVVTAAINADAVTDAKIADDVVGTEHLTANEVDTTALGADAVTGAQLADDAVNSEHYTDGSIDTAHIADGQVTTAKLATAVFTGATDIGADIADADLFLMDDGAGGTIRKTAASRIKTYAGGLTGVSTGSGNVTITDGNLVVASGHGVDFAASSGSLFDDYEEGTWTPGMTTSGGSLSGVSYGSYNKGWYTKIGRNVTLNFNVQLSSKGSGGSGAVRMSGHPFSSTTLLTASVYGSLYMYNGGVDQPCCTYGTFQNYLTLRYVDNASGGEIGYSDIQNNSSWSGMMTYITNV